LARTAIRANRLAVIAGVTIDRALDRWFSTRTRAVIVVHLAGC
jgi:nitrogen fixation/metabolism regulation signal transduction histidine kinase